MGKTLAGVLLFAFGLVCLIATAVYLTQDLSIWVFGLRTVAKVVELDYDIVGENTLGEPTFKYSIQYQFTASNGRVITRTSGVAAREWSGLGVGSPVVVGYFPLYPAHNRLDNSRYVPLYVCAYVPALFLSWLGLAAGWSMLRPIQTDLGTRSLTEALRRGKDNDASG